MLVTNTTAHCFVLSAGVVIRPNAVDVSVADALYAADSTLNQQLDALEAEGFVSISGKPADSFPPPVTSDVDGQVVLTASASDKVPLTITGAAAQTAALLSVGDSDNDVFFVVHGGGQIEMRTTNRQIASFESDGIFFNSADGTFIPLALYAATGQTANLFEAYDEDGNLVTSLDAAGLDLTIIAPDGASEFPQLAVVGRTTQGGGHAEAIVGSGGIFVSGSDDWGTSVAINADPGGQTSDLLLITDAAEHPIFKVAADGSVHIKTGTTIHADL